MSAKKTLFPTKLWAYVNCNGQIIPSTIREKQGDSDEALSCNPGARRKGLDSYKQIRIVVSEAPPQ